MINVQRQELWRSWGFFTLNNQERVSEEVQLKLRAERWAVQRREEHLWRKGLKGQKSWGRNELCGPRELEGSSVGGTEWVGDCWHLTVVGRLAGAVVLGKEAWWEVERSGHAEGFWAEKWCGLISVLQKSPWLLDAEGIRRGNWEEDANDGERWRQWRTKEGTDLGAFGFYFWSCDWLALQSGPQFPHL